MREDKIQNMTLLTWTLQVWSDYRRGQRLDGHLASIAYSLDFHKEWWNDWNTAKEGTDDPSITTRLIHIHNDAAIKTQIEMGQSQAVKAFYDALVQKGFTEFESIHTLGIALAEENAYARAHSETFDQERFVARADRYVKEALSRPNLTRLAKAKAY